MRTTRKNRRKKARGILSILTASTFLMTGCQTDPLRFEDLDSSKIISLAQDNRAANDLVDSYVRRVGLKQAIHETYLAAQTGGDVERVLYCYISEQAFDWSSICNMPEMDSNPAATLNAGLAYLLGKPDIPKNLQAFEASLKRLDEIDPARADWLRYLAFDGEFEPYNDPSVMLSHLIEAAKKRHVGAQRELGRRLLFDGLYVEKDVFLAKHYLQAAYKKNDLKAGMLLIFLFDEMPEGIVDPEEREEIVSRLTEFQYPEFDYYRAFNLQHDNEGMISDESLFLMERSASNGYPSAQFFMAQHFLDSGNRQKVLTGEAYLLELAEEKHHQGMSLLAQEYCTGERLPRDTNECIALWTDAALQGHEASSLKLEQEFVMRGAMESFSPYVTALETSEGESKPAAQYSLYNLYVKGNGVERNLEKANHYLKSAADMDYPPAVSSAEGYDFSFKEDEKAVRAADKMWTEKYVQQGYPDSILRLIRKAEKGEIWKIDKAGEYFLVQFLADQNFEFEHKSNNLSPKLDRETLQRFRALKEVCTIETVFECGAVSSL